MVDDEDAKFLDLTALWYMVPCLGKSIKMVTKPSSSLELEMNSKSNFFDRLPDHLLVEVMCRLPNSKFVIRCKAVCKLWDALLSHPHFAHSFITHKVNCGFVHIDTPENGYYGFERNEMKAEGQQKLLAVIVSHRVIRHRVIRMGLMMYFKDPISDPKRLSFGSLPCVGENENATPPPPIVVGASNDLLLCLKEDLERQKHELFLCNVQTRQWHLLPPPPNLHERNHYGFMCEPYYSFGKGSNKSIVFNAPYRYNIVILPDKTEDAQTFTKLSVHIFSSDTSLWSESILSLQKPCLLNYANTCGFVMNGRLHIRARRQIIGFDPVHKGHNSNGIIDGHVIDMPSIVSISHASIGVWQGQLQVSRIDDSGRLDIWLLTHYEMGQWSLQHSMLMGDFISPDDTYVAKRLTAIRFPKKVLGFHPCRPHVLYLFIAGRIVLCDVRRRVLETLSVIPSGSRKVFYVDSAFWVALPLWPTPLPTA